MYAATLKTGEDVVIKVQKPGVAEVLKTDLGFMYITSKLVEVTESLVKLSDVPELTSCVLARVARYPSPKTMLDT